MKFSRAQKDEALAYWTNFRAKLIARLAALGEGRFDDAMPPSGRSTFWQTVDAQTLRDIIDHADQQIDTLRKVRPID